MAKTGGVKIKRRIKVFVVGHGKVGKTTLIKALERVSSYLWFRHFYPISKSYIMLAFINVDFIVGVK